MNITTFNLPFLRPTWRRCLGKPDSLKKSWKQTPGCKAIWGPDSGSNNKRSAKGGRYIVPNLCLNPRREKINHIIFKTTSESAENFYTSKIIVLVAFFSFFNWHYHAAENNIKPDCWSFEIFMASLCIKLWKTYPNSKCCATHCCA